MLIFNQTFASLCIPLLDSWQPILKKLSQYIFFYSLTLTILHFMTKLPAVHELIYEEKAKKSLDFRIMEIHGQLITKRKNILKEFKITWSF